MSKKEGLDKKEQFIAEMAAALQRRETIVVGADCEVMYSGRAETLLPPGERLIMIKEDGTLLVHQPHGSAPINYMKESSSHRFVVENDNLYIKSQNQVLHEYLDILLAKVHFFHSAKLSDGQKLQLTGNEKDMANMIAANPAIVEEGLKLVGQEEQTKYGFIDVLCYDAQGLLVVIECKRYKADFQAVSQLRRYVERLKGMKGLARVRGILAAPAITTNAAKMLHDFGFSFAIVQAPKYKERLRKSQKSLGEFENNVEND
ncbi:endonuclease NucS [Candidatus Woesearchaeota archaeon]|nr:endonuclease NucS [Candidatus Woesearchaeota archaeon]